MPRATRRKNGGGWSQGPPLSPEQYYLTQYKSYSDCYPMARPGTIQSNGLNPDLAQTGFAGGARRQRSSQRSSKRSSSRRSRSTTKRKVGGSSCAEYFRTRGGRRSTRRSSRSSRSRKSGGCGCMMHGGAFIYGDCPYKANSFNCPYAKGGMQRMQKKNKTRRNLKGGRYGIDPSVSVGGDGPNVAPLTAHVPCEAYRPMPINPHHPTELVSGPETGIHFAGLSPGAVLKGGARRRKYKGGNSMYTGAPLATKYPPLMLNGPKPNCSSPFAQSQTVYTGQPQMVKYPPFVQSQQPMTSHQLINQPTSAPPSGVIVSQNPVINPGYVQAGGLRGDEHPLAYTAPRAGFTFFPNIAQGQTLNPGQIPYQVTVPVDGSDSAACGLTCGQAIADINKA